MDQLVPGGDFTTTGGMMQEKAEFQFPMGNPGKSPGEAAALPPTTSFEKHRIFGRHNAEFYPGRPEYISLIPRWFLREASSTKYRRAFVRPETTAEYGVEI
jgi:hypothetical protein